MAYKNKDDERAFQKRHYEKNKDIYKQRASESRKRTRLRNKQYVQGIKTENPCADCGIKYHFSQMDFDHINNDKEFNLASVTNATISLSRIKAEIDKCELVCSNCHRYRTWKRLQDQSVSSRV